ncbi:MAG: 6-bladed beta-propeller, partial [Planctomycetota bacterium]
HEGVALRDGRVVARIGGRGGEPGRFNFPTAVCWRPPAGLVVADAMNFRVQVFDVGEDRPRLVFGEKGDAAGDFARPRDVAVDSDGHIYVLDNQFENVQVFDQGGRLLMAFGEGGDGPGQFAIPSGITIDARDRIWVADSYNRRVQVFQYLRETQ